MLRPMVSLDWAMKNLLRSKANFGILEGFFSELMHEDITILEVLEGESNRAHALDKGNHVDLKVKDSRGDIVVIEVQFDYEVAFLQRILYGASKVVTEHIARGQGYENVAKVVSVSILYFDLGQGEDYLYHGTTRFVGMRRGDELQLSDEQRRVFGRRLIHEIYPEYYLIKVNRFDDVARDTLDQWIYFLKNESVKPEFTARGLQEARERLAVSLLPEDERRAYEAWIEDERYSRSMAWGQMQVGLVRGRAEGRLEGIDEGRQDERRAIARRMLDAFDDDAIAAATGLTTTEVEALRQS